MGASVGSVPAVSGAGDDCGGGGRMGDGGSGPRRRTPQPRTPACGTGMRQCSGAAGRAGGCGGGVNLDFDRKTLAQYASDLGHRPAVTVTFTDLPYTEAQRADLVRAVEQVRADGQILLLTLEPFGGLETVTEQVARQVAADLAEFNAAGVPVIVRLAHEMNGSWYPWGTPTRSVCGDVPYGRSGGARAGTGLGDDVGAELRRWLSLRRRPVRGCSG